ncbi:MAG: hypothetical protein K8Q89_06245 [Nitrosarchaeum sp.]|nr:hypothetical protein [Nitrosarchaeum sp.]
MELTENQKSSSLHTLKTWVMAEAFFRKYALQTREPNGTELKSYVNPVTIQSKLGWTCLKGKGYQR